MRDGTARRLSSLHRGLYRATAGLVGRRLVGNDMMLLTTRGRRTGKAHTVPLLCLPDGTDVVVIASWGGRNTHPEWYLNLLAEPAVEIQRGGRREPAVAIPMEEPERGHWWELAVAAYPGYETYRQRTQRRIPVVRLRIGNGAREGPP